MPKLKKLDCFDAEGAAKRYERALKMAGRVQMISYAKLESQRWVAFVHNGYTSAVVLSHGLQYGECSCEDFKKNGGKTCKHIYAVVLRINEIKAQMRQTYEEKNFPKAAPEIQEALEVMKEEHKLNNMREKLNKQIEKTIALENNLAEQVEVPGLLRPKASEPAPKIEAGEPFVIE